MERWKVLVAAGAVLVAVGLLLSATPVFGPRPSGEPFFEGTLWAVGLPVALVGGLLVWAGLVSRRPTGPAGSDGAGHTARP